MRIGRLRIEQLRVVEAAEIEPGPGLLLFTGPNGAGKTSVLEALHLLAYGRSFRSPSREVLIRRSAAELSVFAEVLTQGGGGTRRLGLSCSARGWKARIDGEPVAALGELLRCCPVVCFEPGSHALIAGASDGRRRFLDWGLFHVEQSFQSVWRRYHRALKQRNALLKGSPSAADLQPWDLELIEAGDMLHALREVYVAELIPHLQAMASALMPEVGPPSLNYTAGWKLERGPFAAELAAGRDRDLATGYSNIGPHRANWQISYPQLPDRDGFSRGQEKLTALVCVLAQASHFASRTSHWPIIALDDLASELDRAHQQLAMEAVAGSGAQIWITGTEPPPGLDFSAIEVTRFHVEQGRVRRAL
jgi:DNA replication and repair protein RecF